MDENTQRLILGLVSYNIALTKALATLVAERSGEQEEFEGIMARFDDFTNKYKEANDRILESYAAEENKSVPLTSNNKN